MTDKDHKLAQTLLERYLCARSNMWTLAGSVAHDNSLDARTLNPCCRMTCSCTNATKLTWSLYLKHNTVSHCQTDHHITNKTVTRTYLIQAKLQSWQYNQSFVLSNIWGFQGSENLYCVQWCLLHVAVCMKSCDFIHSVFQLWYRAVNLSCPQALEHSLGLCMLVS